MVFPFILLNQLPKCVGDGETSVDDGGVDFSDLASISSWDVCFIVRLCK